MKKLVTIFALFTMVMLTSFVEPYEVGGGKGLQGSKGDLYDVGGGKGLQGSKGDFYDVGGGKGLQDSKGDK